MIEILILDTDEIAKMLIQHGADVNAEVWYKWTPVHLAIVMEGAKEHFKTKS